MSVNKCEYCDKMPVGQMFCEACGRRLVKVLVPPPPPTPPPSPIPEDIGHRPASKNKAVIGVLVAVIAVMAVVLIWVLAGSNTGESGDTRREEAAPVIAAVVPQEPPPPPEPPPTPPVVPAPPPPTPASSPSTPAPPPSTSAPPPPQKASPPAPAKKRTTPEPAQTPPASTPPQQTQTPAQLATAANLRGKAHYNKKDYDKAIVDFTEAIRLNPDNAVFLYNRGNAYYSKYDYDKAIVDFTEAIRLNSNDADYRNMRGNAFYRKKDYDKAIADYTEALRLSPNDGKFKQNLELAIKMRDESREKASEQINRIIITSIPSGGAVEIDGERKCTTPCTLTKLPLGSMSITVSKLGFVTETKNVNYSGGSVNYSFPLTKAP